MANDVGAPIMAGATQVEFTNALLNKRRLIRAYKNPLDKCTIISIFPRALDEVKHTIEPGYFHIDAGSRERPSTLVVGSSSWWKDIDADQPMLEIPNSSIQIADSIIKDYCNGMLGCDMGEAMPGLFFVLGEKSLPQIIMEYKKKLDEMEKKQKNWYQILVKLADSLWARTQGNPLVIWDLMRVAAQDLGMDRPWVKDFQSAELVRCAFCGGMRNNAYPICPTCKAIDPKHPLAGEIKFAL